LQSAESCQSQQSLSRFRGRIRRGDIWPGWKDHSFPQPCTFGRDSSADPALGAAPVLEKLVLRRDRRAAGQCILASEAAAWTVVPWPAGTRIPHTLRPRRKWHIPDCNDHTRRHTLMSDRIPGAMADTCVRLFGRGEAFDSEGFISFFTDNPMYQF